MEYDNIYKINVDKLLKDIMNLPPQEAKQEAVQELASIAKAPKQAVDKVYNINSAIDHIKNRRFIVGSFSADLGLSFSETPAIHFDAAAARSECRRLARMNPGKLYLFVQLVGAEMVPTVQAVSV